MIKTATKKDILWSYFAQIFQFGAGIIVLPIVLKKLPSNELAIWYVFLTIYSLVNLLDFGFRPTIARNVSYVFSGLKSLPTKGIGSIHDVTESQIDYHLLSLLTATCEKIYRIISICCLVSVAFASLYVYSLISDFENKTYIICAWFIFGCSCTLNFYFSYYGAFLIGCGKIKESRKIVIYSKSIFIFATYFGLAFDWGIVAISFAHLLNSLTVRWLSYKYYYSRNLKNKIKRFSQPHGKEELQKIFKALWGNSYRLGLVSLGSFLILKFNYFICISFIGVQIAAQYGLTQQLLEFSIECCLVIFNTYLPIINANRIQRNTENVKKFFSISLIIAWLTYMSAVIVIICFGQWGLLLLKSQTFLLPVKLFLFYSFVMFLEFNHSISAALITTKNEVPFVLPALISGCFIALFSFIAVKYLALGVFGVIFSQFIVQLVYNNWKWPKVVLDDLETTPLNLIRIGCVNLKLKIAADVTEYVKRKI